MSGGGKTQTSTSTMTVPPEVTARYNAVNSRAEDTAATPFQAYSQNPNDFVAQMTPAQRAAMSQAQGAATMAQPWFNAAGGATMAGMGPANLGELDTNKYMNPYTNYVVQNTADILGQQNQQAMSGALGSAIGAGAGWGDRSGIAAANLARQQTMGMGSAIGNLYSQGYSQALNTAQQQQGADLAARQANLTRLLQGGQGLGQLGTGAQGAAIAGSQNLMNMGTQEQQTEQAGKSALYNQYQQERAYPFQIAQFLANIAMGTGALSGSTTTTTQPAPFWSDERLKENIEKVGKLDDGQPIYRFNYKGRPGETQIGLMAQDVERKHPEAVGLAGGYKTVDYNRATEDAASMGGSVSRQRAGLGFARGGYADGGSPDYSAMVIQQLFGGAGPNGGAYGLGNAGMGGMGYVPQASLPVGQLRPAEPVAPAPQTGLSQAISAASDVADIADTGSKLWDKFTEKKDKSPFDINDEDDDTLDGQIHNARGGSNFARGGLAAGGGMPYDPKNTGYVPDNTPSQAPKLMTPSAAAKPDNPMDMIKDVAKIATMFMAKGGAVNGHTVLPGDTLSGIAKKYGKTLEEILEANPKFQQNPDLIRVGELINIPHLAQAAGTPTAGYNRSMPSTFPERPGLAGSMPRADETLPSDYKFPTGGFGQERYSGSYMSDPSQKGLMNLLKLKAMRHENGLASGGVAGRHGYAPGGWAFPEELVPYWKRMRHIESGDKQFGADGTVLTSPKDAYGIAQIQEPSAKEAAAFIGEEYDPERLRNDADYNERLGQGYFAKMYQTYGSPEYAAAAYNAGPGRLEQAIDQARAHGGNWQDYIPSSTRETYLPRVMGDEYNPSAPKAGLSTGAINQAATPSQTEQGGLLPKDWQSGIDKFNQWGKDNESFIVPLLSGIGSMLASPSITLGGSLGAGLVGGAKSFSDVLNAQSNRNLQGAEADYNRSLLVRPASIKGMYEVFDPKTGQKRLMSVGELRDNGIPVPDGAEETPAPGLAPTAPAAPETASAEGAGERPSWIKKPYFEGAPEAPAVEAPAAEAPASEDNLDIPQPPKDYAFKPVINENGYQPAASVQLSPAAIAEARKPSAIDYDEGAQTYQTLSDSVQANKAMRTDLLELANAIGTVPATGFMTAGTGAEARAEALKFANTVNRLFGNAVDENFDRYSTAADIIAKINAFLGSGKANQLGQHAASIASTLSAVMPGLQTNPAAARELIANMLISTQKPIDQFDYYNKWQEVSGGVFAGAKKSFENDSSSAYPYDKEAMKRAMTPADIGGVIMTPIEALRTHIITPDDFNEFYPGVIRYVYGQ